MECSTLSYTELLSNSTKLNKQLSSCLPFFIFKDVIFAPMSLFWITQKSEKWLDWQLTLCTLLFHIFFFRNSFTCMNESFLTLWLLLPPIRFDSLKNVVNDHLSYLFLNPRAPKLLTFLNALSSSRISKCPPMCPPSKLWKWGPTRLWPVCILNRVLSWLPS